MRERNDLEAPPGGLDFNWDYAPPIVKYVTTLDGGTHPEPPFADEMTDLQKLRHLAALVESETGIRVRICDGQYWRGGRFVSGTFSWQIGHSDGSNCSFSDTWSTLTAVELGAREALRGNA